MVTMSSMGLAGVAGFGGSSMVCSAMLSTVAAPVRRPSDGPRSAPGRPVTGPVNQSSGGQLVVGGSA